MPDRIETEAFRDAGISQVMPDDCYQRAEGEDGGP
jgi:hypothetical protein